MAGTNHSREWETTTRAAERGDRATLRVERTSREKHNVLVGPAITPPAAPDAVVLVVEVTGDLSDNGLHPAKLYRLDSMPQLNDPPDPIVWVEVTGDFNVKPMPGQTLATGDTGVAVLVGSYGGAPVYSLGGPPAASPTNCRSMLVGKGADSALTGVIPAGVGKCSNVGPATVYMAYDAALVATNIGYWGGWVSTPFTTRQGATTAAVYLSDRADPTALLSSSAGSGGAVERPMTFLGCDSLGRMRFVTFDCLWCDDVWVGPCGSNQFELLVGCGAPPVTLCSCDIPRVYLLRLTVTGDGNAGLLGPHPDPTAGVGLSGSYPLTYGTVIGGLTPPTVWYGRFRVNAGGPGWITIYMSGPEGDGCTFTWRIEFDADAVDEGPAPYSVETGISLLPPFADFNPDYSPVAPVDSGWKCTPSFLGRTSAYLRTPGGEYQWSANLRWGPDVTAVEFDPCGDPIPPCSPCYDAAGEPLAGHPNVALAVPDGDFVGSYTPLVWGGSYWSKAFTIEGDSYEWRLSCAAGVWTLDLYKTGEIRNTGSATTRACRPFGLVFDGADFGGTSDLVIGLAA